MNILALLGIIIFVVLLSIMSFRSGTQESISALVKDNKYLLLLALWSLIMILPQAVTLTPEPYKIIPFLGIMGILICGGANVLNKNDELIHIVAAIITFVSFTIWVLIINKLYLFILILCLCAGKDRIKWRTEIGLIIAVYLILLLNIFKC